MPCWGRSASKIGLVLALSAVTGLCNPASAEEAGDKDKTFSQAGTEKVSAIAAAAGPAALAEEQNLLAAGGSSEDGSPNYEELEKRLYEQQQMLEKQSQLIEQQQKQIDELRQSVEKLSQSSAPSAAKDEQMAKEGQKKTPDGQSADSQPEMANGEKPAAGDGSSGDGSGAELADGEKTAASSGEAGSESAGADTPEGQGGDELAETADPGPTPPGAEEAPTQATAQASGQQSEMNPNISLILLGGAQGGGAPDDEYKNSFFLQEAELGISAPVDPNTKAEAYISAHRGGGLEVEEAFVQYSGLGHGLQLRGGIMLNEVGALNSTHTHALPQIDRPLNYSMFLGDEGLSTPGAEVSYLLPVPWYSKVTASVSSRVNHHEHGHEEAEKLAGTEHEHEHEHEEAETEEEFSLFPKSDNHNPLFTVRWENMADLNDDTTLALGLSHATSKIDNGTIRNSSLTGADLTLKWHPAEDTYKELVWRSEYLKAKQSYAAGSGQENKDLDGWYSYLSYRLNRNLRFGLRYDEADSPLVHDGRVKRASAIAEFIANEWNSLRLQYNHTDPSWQKSYNEVLLQWNVVLGPHGAHKY
ncbi:MAG: hypothetical protein Q4F00_09185 [bacterium]|nr:hypothetical protein [bacterium]